MLAGVRVFVGLRVARGVDSVSSSAEVEGRARFRVGVVVGESVSAAPAGVEVLLLLGDRRGESSAILAILCAACVSLTT